MRPAPLLVTLLVCGLAAVSLAQPKPGGQGGRGQGGGIRMMGAPRMMAGDTNANLLGISAVQTELHLSPAQVQKIKASMPERGGGAASGGNRTKPGLRQGGPGGPGGPGGSDFRQEMEKRMKAMQKLLTILNPAQKTRLREITLQSYGAAALGITSVQQAVGLRKDQIVRINAENEKIMKLRQAQMQNMGTMRPDQAQDQKAWEARIAKMRAENERFRAQMSAATDRILTAPQRSKWHSMLGKPFDVSKLRQRRNGGPGGRGGR